MRFGKFHVEAMCPTPAKTSPCELVILEVMARKLLRAWAHRLGDGKSLLQANENSLFLGMREFRGLDNVELSSTVVSFCENSLLLPVTPCFRFLSETTEAEENLPMHGNRPQFLSSMKKYCKALSGHGFPGIAAYLFTMRPSTAGDTVLRTVT
jgi:hypothetical protein